MRKRTKILILGIGQSNFLNQLYSEILKEDENFAFSIDQYFELKNGKIKKSSLPYDDFYNFKSEVIPKWKLRKTLLNFSKTKFFWEIIFFEISQKQPFQKIKNLLYDFARAKYRVENFIHHLDVDIIHFHFCTPDNLKEIFFLDPKRRTICTFWGSDLMRSTGVSNVFYVKRALENTDVITVQTPELAEILYCKYGRNLSSKLVTLRFTLELRIFDEIDSQRNKNLLLNDFKKRYSIPLDKVVVALGHNAFSENNHLLMIEQIRKLPREITDNLIFLLHLGYGGNPKYISLLQEIAETENELKIIIINEFLNERETALLRLSTDLLIQMPISDALSAAMTEVLYAGNAVITGAWLPYGILRRNGIRFFEVENFTELANTIQNFLNTQQKEEKENENGKFIKKLLFPERTTPPWVSLFNDLSK